MRRNLSTVVSMWICPRPDSSISLLDWSRVSLRVMSSSRMSLSLEATFSSSPLDLGRMENEITGSGSGGMGKMTCSFSAQIVSPVRVSRILARPSRSPATA